MTIDMYKVHEQEQLEKSYHDYISDPHFQELSMKAERRGFRHASLWEIKTNAPKDLYCWSGGLWTKM